MEYHSFLFIDNYGVFEELVEGFPSPYGVIFILTEKEKFGKFGKFKFPSPCGVSLILILWENMINEGATRFPSPYRVSFILMK